MAVFDKIICRECGKEFSGLNVELCWRCNKKIKPGVIYETAMLEPPEKAILPKPKSKRL